MVFNKHWFLDIFYILCIVNMSLCNDNLYEQISLYVQESEFVDPNSLYYNRQSQTIQIPKNDEGKDGDINQISPRDLYNPSFCKDNHYEVFVKRLINMLVLKSNFKLNDGKVYGKLDLEATIEELEIMKNFAQGNISIRRIDSVISNVIRPISITLFNDIFSYTNILIIYIYENRAYLGLLIITLITVRISIKTKWSIKTKIILVTYIFFMSSYIINYMKLIKNEEIKVIARQKEYSMSFNLCNHNNDNSYSKVHLFLYHIGISTINCERFYESTMKDPVLEVTPMHVLIDLCTTAIFHPFKSAANHLSDAIQIYTEKMSGVVNFFLQIPILICTPIIILIFLLLCCTVLLNFGIKIYFHRHVDNKKFLFLSTLLAKNCRQTIKTIDSDTSKENIISSFKNIKNQITEKKSTALMMNSLKKRNMKIYFKKHLKRKLMKPVILNQNEI